MLWRTTNSDYVLILSLLQSINSLSTAKGLRYFFNSTFQWCNFHNTHNFTICTGAEMYFRVATHWVREFYRIYNRYLKLDTTMEITPLTNWKNTNFWLLKTQQHLEKTLFSYVVLQNHWMEKTFNNLLSWKWIQEREEYLSLMLATTFNAMENNKFRFVLDSVTFAEHQLSFNC